MILDEHVCIEAADRDIRGCILDLPELLLTLTGNHYQSQKYTIAASEAEARGVAREPKEARAKCLSRPSLRSKDILASHRRLKMVHHHDGKRHLQL